MVSIEKFVSFAQTGRLFPMTREWKWGATLSLLSFCELGYPPSRLLILAWWRTVVTHLTRLVELGVCSF